MDEKKEEITRRAAIVGTAVAGLGLTTSALILRNLRGSYETDIPTGAHPFAPASVTSSSTVTVNGYTLEIPPVTMEIEKPSDWAKYQTLCKEATTKAIDNDPGYQAHLKRQLAARKDAREGEAKEWALAKNAKWSPERMEAEIQRYNTRIDKDDTVDAANRELLKKGFRESMKKAYEARAAQTETL